MLERVFIKTFDQLFKIVKSCFQLVKLFIDCLLFNFEDLKMNRI